MKTAGLRLKQTQKLGRHEETNFFLTYFGYPHCAPQQESNPRYLIIPSISGRLFRPSLLEQT